MKLPTIDEWLDDHLICGVWDDPRHAVTNLVTCGFTPEAAEAAVKEREMFMQFKTKEEE
jgi:hypothetical protein